jgi:hypothetical protein
LTSPASYGALTGGELRRRRDRLADYLDAWGDLRVNDLGSGGTLRLLQFALEAPGESLPIEVRAVYREFYSRRRDGDWDIAKYTYEYLDLSCTKRLAYHPHDLGTRPSCAWRL